MSQVPELKTMTKSQIMKRLEAIPMDGKITIAIAPTDYDKAKMQSVFGDSCIFGLSGETSDDGKDIEFTVWAETE